MKVSLYSKLRGYAVIEVRGGSFESFVNETGRAGLFIWNIRRTSSERMELHILLPHFFRLRPILKRTRCRVRVLERHGVPFLLDRLFRRKLFVAGAILFMIGLYLLSSLIWQVEVAGNEKMTEEQVLDAAEQEGVYPLQWTFRLKDTDQLARNMLTRLPGISWVGFERRGTKMIIKIVESSVPEQKDLQNPRHLVSTADAVITELVAERGKPLVRKHSRVKKGDVLISGIIGNEEHQRTVVAEGVARGLVWHEFEIVSPLRREHKAYTGETKKKQYLVVGNWGLKLFGYGKTTFEQYEILSNRSIWQWRNITFPIGWLTERWMEVRVETSQLGKQEAHSIGLEQAKAEIMAKYGRDAIVKEQKILHENSENGKVYMKVLFEVEQNIAKEEPIVHVQGE